MGRSLILLAICLVISAGVPAQDTLVLKTKKELRLEKLKSRPEKGDVFIMAVPTIGYNPSNGFLFGAGSTASFFLGDPANTSISSSLAGISYTTKKQLIFTARSTVYTDNNKWVLNGDWRFLNTSQPTYGLGTGPQSSKLATNGFEIDDGVFSAPISDEQMLTFDQFRFYETISREVREMVYLGIGYHLDIFSNTDDKLLDMDTTPPVITSYYAYNYKYGFSQTGNTLSGISLNASYDSRDNQNNAYTGAYASLSFRVNPTWLGSDKSSTMLWMEYRRYLDLTKDHHNMLCFWGIGNFVTTGTVPYLDLPAIGEDLYAKTGRGYIQGRFRGQRMVYGEAELRKHLLSTTKRPDVLGMVIFLNATTATNEDAGIQLFDNVNFGLGAGLRIMILKNARTSLGLDYGWGNYGSSGFYLKLNEAF